jgi:hypothetical protein
MFLTRVIFLVCVTSVRKPDTKSVRKSYQNCTKSTENIGLDGHATSAYTKTV